MAREAEPPLLHKVGNWRTGDINSQTESGWTWRLGADLDLDLDSAWHFVCNSRACCSSSGSGTDGQCLVKLFIMSLDTALCFNVFKSVRLG